MFIIQAKALLYRAIHCLGILKNYAFLRVSSRETKEKHRKYELKARFRAWKKAFRFQYAYINSKCQEMDLAVQGIYFRKLRELTVGLARRKVDIVKNKIVNYRCKQRAFYFWRLMYQEFSYESEMMPVALAFLRKRNRKLKVDIITEWRLVVAESKVQRKVSMALLQERVLPLWKKKFQVRKLLSRVFRLCNLAWELKLEVITSMSPFQIMLTLFTEWRAIARQSAEERRVVENESKALVFRGSYLLANFFYQWKIFLKLVKSEKDAADRKTLMIFRMSFYQLACYSAQSKLKWQQFLEKVRTRTKKRIIYFWKVYVLKHEFLFPASIYHRHLLKENLRNWKLYITMKRVSKLPMPALDLNLFQKPAFDSWKLLMVKRERYRIGIKKLHQVFAVRFVMRRALYKMPGRIQYQKSEEMRLQRLRNPRSSVRILSNIEQMEKLSKINRHGRIYSKFDLFLATNPGESREHAGKKKFGLEEIKSLIEFVPEPIRIRAVKFDCFQVEGCTNEENTQRVYYIMSQMLHGWYRYCRHEQQLRLRSRQVRVLQNRHVTYRYMKRWVQAVPRTNHRHFTWMPMKNLRLHDLYMQRYNTDADSPHSVTAIVSNSFHGHANSKFDSAPKGNGESKVEGSAGTPKGGQGLGRVAELIKKEVQVIDAYGAYERASEYISKLNK